MRTRTSTSTTSVRESRTTIGAHRSPNECFVRSPCACVCFCVQFADIIIYDEEADKHVHIPFEKACAAAGLTGAAAIADGDERTAAMPGWCSSKAKTTAAINNSKSGTYQSGVCVVIVRPFIEHLMMSAVMTVAGRDTGATLFGPAGKPFSPHSCPFLVSTCTHTHSADACVFLSPFLFADMQISANTSVKTIEGAQPTTNAISFFSQPPTPPCAYTLTRHVLLCCFQVTTRTQTPFSLTLYPCTFGSLSRR